MTLDERKLLAKAFMAQQYHACLYELNLKPSEIMKITIDMLKNQGPVFDKNFIVIDKNYDDIPCCLCPFIIKKSERIKI